MSDLPLDELQAVAEAATPGPWSLERGFSPEDGPHIAGPSYEGDGECVYPTLADATHIATFDPPTVLALIAEVRRLRAENEKGEFGVMTEDGEPIGAYRTLEEAREAAANSPVEGEFLDIYRFVESTYQEATNDD